MLDVKLLEVLVCPVSKTPLIHRENPEELWCRASRLAYPVRDGLPFLLEEQARRLSQEELDSLSA